VFTPDLFKKIWVLLYQHTHCFMRSVQANFDSADIVFLTK